VQTPSPASDLKVPAGHDVQTLLPPPGPVVPALHMHAAADVLFAAEMELAGHNEHSSSPENSLYFPEVQATQDATGVERVQPGLQVQSVAWSLPAGAVVYGGHTTHTVASVAPTGVVGTSAWAGVYVTQVCFHTNVHICHTLAAGCDICVYVYMCVYACICTWMRMCIYDIA